MGGGGWRGVVGGVLEGLEMIKMEPICTSMSASGAVARKQTGTDEEAASAISTFN